jgi:hypothetical protein
MRDKFRLYLLLHERILFRRMVVAVWLVIGLTIYIVTRDPVEEFISGRSAHLDGYDLGPVMSGLK